MKHSGTSSASTQKRGGICPVEPKKGSQPTTGPSVDEFFASFTALLDDVGENPEQENHTQSTTNLPSQNVCTNLEHCQSTSDASHVIKPQIRQEDTLNNPPASIVFSAEDNTKRVSSTDYLLEIPLGSVVQPQDYHLFINDLDRAFLRKHSHPDAVLPEMTKEMRQAIIMSRREDTIPGQSSDSVKETREGSMQRDPIPDGCHKLVENPFMNDISQYKGKIWEYDPETLHEIISFNTNELSVDPSKCWLRKTLPKD